MMNWALGFPTLHRHFSSGIQDAFFRFVPITQFQVHSQSVLLARFSPDGKFVASCGADGVLSIFDLEHNVCSARLPTGEGSINDLCWDGRGSTVFVAASSGACICYDAHNLPNIKSTAIFERNDEKTHAEVNRVNHHSIYRSSEPRMPFSSSVTGVSSSSKTSSCPVSSPISTGDLATYFAMATCVTTPQSYGQFFLTGGYDEFLCKWDIRQFQCVTSVRAHDAPLTSAGFSHDERLILTASHDGCVRIWDPFTLDIRLTCNQENPIPLHSAIFTPTSRAFVCVPFHRTADIRLTSLAKPNRHIFFRNTDVGANDDNDMENPTLSSNLVDRLALPVFYGTPAVMSHYVAIAARQVDIWNTRSSRIEAQLCHYSNRSSPLFVTSVACSPQARDLSTCLCVTTGADPDNRVLVWVPDSPSSP